MALMNIKPKVGDVVLLNGHAAAWTWERRFQVRAVRGNVVICSSPGPIDGAPPPAGDGNVYYRAHALEVAGVEVAYD